MNYKKISVIGSPNSGKTTLVNLLKNKLQITHVEYDGIGMLYYDYTENIILCDGSDNTLSTFSNIIEESEICIILLRYDFENNFDSCYSLAKGKINDLNILVVVNYDKNYPEEFSASNIQEVTPSFVLNLRDNNIDTKMDELLNCVKYMLSNAILSTHK